MARVIDVFIDRLDISGLGFKAETADTVSVDGSKFKVVNNRDKNFTKAKMKRRIAVVEATIEKYLDRLDQADAQASPDDTRRCRRRSVHLKRGWIA